MKRNGFVLLVVLWLVAALPAWAQRPTVSAATPAPKCEKVGGVLMTNIGAIPNTTPNPSNLGPVFGDLKGAVAATLMSLDASGVWFQHYWVTEDGDTINFKQAHLTPTSTDDPNVLAVKWGNYLPEIVPGGTGKYANATGHLDCFGLADFSELTLVLRYRGEVCYVPQE